MKALILAAALPLAGFVAGCAQETFYDRGKPVAKIQGNVKGFDYKVHEPGHDLAIHTDEIDNAAATIAGGQAVSQGANAFTTGATGFATATLLHIPK